MLKIQVASAGYTNRHFEAADRASIRAGTGAHGGARARLFVLANGASAVETALWNAIPKEVVVEAQEVCEVGKKRTAVRLTAKTMSEAEAQSAAFYAALEEKKSTQGDKLALRAAEVADRLAEIGLEVDAGSLITESAAYRWTVDALTATGDVVTVDLSGPVFAMASKPVAEIPAADLKRMCRTKPA